LRYRSFGRSGQAISALSLALDDDHLRPAEMVNLVAGAMDHGINAFEARCDNIPAIHAIGQAVAGLDRKLVIVGLRIPPASRGKERNLSRDAIIKILQDALRQTGLRWIDYLLVEDPEPDEISPSFHMTVEAARQAKRLRYAGVAGDADSIDALLEAGRIHIYSARFNLRSGWQTRNRLKVAMHSGVISLGYDYHPRVVKESGVLRDEMAEAPRRAGILGWATRPRIVDVERTGPYAFLDQIRGWTADQVCLAYALTEPALASVRIDAADIGAITHLADIVEREMPNGLPAQIELARVADLS